MLVYREFKEAMISILRIEEFISLKRLVKHKDSELFGILMNDRKMTSVKLRRNTKLNRAKLWIIEKYFKIPAKSGWDD